MGAHVVAEEAGGSNLVRSRIGDQIAGNLLAEKLVVGLVFLECINHPIPPRPHVAVVIDREPVGVGIARSI